MQHLVVVLNGALNLKKIEFDCQHVPTTSEIYVADGGARYLQKLEWKQAQHIFFCGDFDSHSKEEQQQVQKECQSAGVAFSVTTKTRQDLSDFAFVLDLISKKYSPSEELFIDVLCGLGKRSDHERSNLFEAALFVQKREAQSVVAFHPKMVIAKGEIQISHSGIFSLQQPFGKYPLQIEMMDAEFSGTQTLLRPSHGLSNKSQEKVTICSSEVFLFEKGEE